MMLPISVFTGEGAFALQVGLHARRSSVQWGGRSRPVSSSRGVGPSIAELGRITLNEGVHSFQRETQFHIPHSCSFLWLMLWQRLPFVQRLYMFQQANKLKIHTGEQDNKFKYWAVFLNIYLNGLTPQDEHSSYECTRNNHFFGAQADRYALQHNKIWKKTPIDDVNSFLLLLLFISLAEFSSAHRQDTWIDIEILIWDLFSELGWSWKMHLSGEK